MKKYQKPNEVLEALNYRCLVCRKVFRTPQGLMGHLSKVHFIFVSYAEYGCDWGVTKAVSTYVKLGKNR